MKIVFTGDSITANLGLSNPANGYANLVAAGLSVPFVNTAVSGYTSTNLLNNITSLVLNHNPTHCMIMIGTNDFIQASITGVPSEVSLVTYKNNIQQICNILGNNNIKPIFLSPIPSLMPSQQLRAAAFSNALQDICTERGINFINANAGFMYYLNNRTIAEYNNWYLDVYHLSEIGHYILSYFILKTQIK